MGSQESDKCWQFGVLPWPMGVSKPSYSKDHTTIGPRESACERLLTNQTGRLESPIIETVDGLNWPRRDRHLIESIAEK
jgi:hypothetical protein